MAISYINTSEVDSIAKEINTLADEFNEEINKLYQRLLAVPTNSKEWFGKQSNYYFGRISKDKQQYIDFGNKIREISNKLYSDANEVNICLKNNINGES